MSTVWVVAADATRARFFRTDASGKQLEEVSDMVNPRARFPDRELASDAQGRTSSGGSAVVRHAYGKNHAERDALREFFARDVAGALEKYRVHGELERLYIISERGFLGLLRKHLGKQLQKHIVGEIAKDLTSDSASSLRSQLPRML